MRSYIALAAVLAALGGQGAFAGEQAGRDQSNSAPPFAEDGVYIPAGETTEIVIAGVCRRFTNNDGRIGFFFSPSQPGSWPSKNEKERDPLEPIVTEGPCR